MSHHTARSAYQQLQERLNRFPQGAPPSETLYRILAILFSKREAELVAQLPIKPFTARDAARIWKLGLAAILGVILKLPPLKQALASQQMRSVYLEKLAAKVKA